MLTVRQHWAQQLRTNADSSPCPNYNPINICVYFLQPSFPRFRALSAGKGTRGGGLVGGGGERLLIIWRVKQCSVILMGSTIITETNVFKLTLK